MLAQIEGGAPANDDRSAARPPAPLGTFSQWWLIVCVTAASTVATIDKNILALLVGAIKADLGLTDTRMSFLLGSAFALVYTAAIIPAGPLADRFRRKYIVAGGVALWSVMSMACGLAGTYAQMFAARVGVGAGEGIIQPSLVSLVRSGVDPSRRGRAYSMLALAPLIGAGLAVILGGAVIGLISRIGPVELPFSMHLRPWQMTLICVGAVGLPIAVLASTIREPSRQAGARVGDLDYRPVLRLMKKRSLVFGCLIGFALVNQMISAAYGAWTPSILMRQQGLSPMQIGARFGGLMLVAAPIGVTIAGILMDRAARAGNARLPLWIGAGALAITTIAATLAPIVPDPRYFWLLLTLQVLVGAAPGAAVMVLLAQATPEAIMGKVSAINLIVMGFFGVALAPTLAAIIGDSVFAAAGPRSIGHGVSSLCFAAGTIGVVLMLILSRVPIGEQDRHG